jgi:hypothetical protein
MSQNHWLSETHHDSKPLAQHNSQRITTNGSAKHQMIDNHCLSIPYGDLQQLDPHNTR